MHCLFKRAVEDCGFSRTGVVGIAASPGRDRIFMGHTDSPGLGGTTINAATEAEIISVAQRDRDLETIEFTNHDTADFPPFSLAMPLLHAAGALIDEHLGTLPSLPEHSQQHKAGAASDEQTPSTVSSSTVSTALLAAAAAAQERGKQGNAHCAALHRLWSARDWKAYSSAALAVMFSSAFPHATDVRSALSASGTGGLRLHFAALDLPSTGGVSSSAALTGAISMGIQSIFGFTWPRVSHAAVDMAEYLLGKTAGAADKTAQLFAAQGRAVVVSSFPEKFLRTVSIPATHIRVFMVDTDIPRVTTTAGRAALLTHLSPEDAAAVCRWGTGVMQSCGATAYECAASHIQQAIASGGLHGVLSPDKLQLVSKALFNCSKDEVQHAPPALLRELAAGGQLAALVPDAHLRHSIVYRVLTCVPQQVELNGCVFWPRGAALYGVSECERGAVYEHAMAQLADDAAQDSHAGAVATVLRCVNVAHDGDRCLWDAWPQGEAKAVNATSGAAAEAGESTAPLPGEDEMGGLQLYQPGDRQLWQGSSAARECEQQKGWTDWARRSAAGDVAAAHVTNVQLMQWSRDAAAHPLQWKSGSFQRSLPQFDAAADALAAQFPGKAALRVAAAGIGGCVAMHCTCDVASSVRTWLQDRMWKPREVRPGQPTDVLAVASLQQLVQ